MVKKKLEETIRAVYRNWKRDNLTNLSDHPDEEVLAGFMEKRLPAEGSAAVREHILHCERCSEITAVTVSLGSVSLQNTPPEYLARVKGVRALTEMHQLLEIVLQVKAKALEVIHCSGDLLVGQELIPASILRSRSLNEFSDEVTILKDYDKVRVQARIERQEPGLFKAVITVTCKQSQKSVCDVRVTLIKENIELESYLTQSGTARFEHIPPGTYVVEITSREEKLAVILLEIRD